MVREFEGQLLDLQLAPLEFGVALNELRIAFGELVLQGKKVRQDLFLLCEINAVPSRCKAQIHEPNYTIQKF